MFGWMFRRFGGDVFLLRSNLNTRGVNSREHFCFFGHSSLSHHAFLGKIGGNLPLSVPELSKPSGGEKNGRKTPKFTDENLQKT